MRFRLHLSMLPAVLILLAASACAGSQVAPSGPVVSALQRSSTANAGDIQPDSNKSILKLLTKSVVIGSTVDPTNGDMGPRALSIAPCKDCGVLKPGQLVVCNFENSSGTPGSGTTIEYLNPEAGSSPTRFVQSNSIEGCDGDAVTSINAVYGAGLTSGDVVEFQNTEKAEKTYSGQPVADPFSDVDALPKAAFSPEYIFVGTTTGGIVSISGGFYGDGDALQVADGFAVSSGSGWSELAPSGLQYNRSNDALYIVDGANNTIVAFSHASELLEKDEIVVEPGGKTFKCVNPSVTCATLVYSGAPLNAPVAATLLPNGNLVVANTQGTANELVELTPAGKILDTKVVDTSSTQGVYGLRAAGTTAAPVLFYTDTNSNEIIELEE
jgi:hypothetical protein